MIKTNKLSINNIEGDHLLHRPPIRLVKNHEALDAEYLSFECSVLVQPISISLKYPIILITGSTACGKSTLALELVHQVLAQTNWGIRVVCSELGGPAKDDMSDFAVAPNYKHRIRQVNSIAQLQTLNTESRSTEQLLVLDDVLTHTSDTDILKHNGPMIVVSQDTTEAPFDSCDYLFNRVCAWFSNHLHVDPDIYLDKLHGKAGISYRGAIKRQYVNLHDKNRATKSNRGCFIAVTRDRDAVERVDTLKEAYLAS